MEFRGLIIYTLLTGLFIFAIISFAINISTSNNPNSTIMRNEVINRSYRSLETNLSGLQGQAENKRTSFLSEVPIVGEITTVFKSIFGVGSTFITIVRDISNIFAELINVGLGFGEESGAGTIILGVFVTLIIVSGILLAWSVYKAGR